MPTDPRFLDALLAGPFGFLVIIAVLLWWAAKDYRKGREEDVSGEKERADKAEAERDTLDGQVAQQRLERRRETEALHAQIFQLRQMLIDRGVRPEELP